jgi:hypothetical protein
MNDQERMRIGCLGRFWCDDIMNVSLSESPWLSFSGFANVSDGGLRMCSVGITANSFKERERPSGTSC